MVSVRPTRGLGRSSISRWVTTVASLPAATGVNVCRADGPSSSAGMPVLDPERAGVLVAGRLDSLQPFRHHMGVRSEIQGQDRSEEHTSELQSLMRISYAVFCLKKKKQKDTTKERHNDAKHIQ